MASSPKVRTTQLGDKLFILNGVDPLRYVDLAKNKVHQYKKPNFITRYIYRVKHRRYTR